MLEVSRVGIAEGDEEIELSLELSIGGSYGKLEKLKQEEDSGKENEKGVEDIVQRSGFSFPETMILGDQLDRESGSGSEVFESQKKREIQALRRQEARRKREEKQLRKSGSNGVANENDLLWLEAQKLQARVRDRELRENDGLLEESARKKEEISKCGDKDSNFTFRNCEIGNEKNDLGPKVAASCLQNVPVIMQMPGPYSELQPKNGFVYPLHNVVGKEENEIKGRNVFRPMGCGSFRPYPNANGKLKHDLGCDSEQSSAIKKVISNGSQERSSSAISDYQSASGKGGSSSETGSHSSCFIANEQQFGVPATNDKLAKTESNGSSDKNGLGQVPGVEVSANVKVVAPTSESKEPTNVAEGSNSMGCLPQMPCVSATGNGPNGKTITGFLYRYTKTEVSIVCVCHGTSFSPAEFVEHAGGTDITNPLRHITMIPSSFE